MVQAHSIVAGTLAGLALVLTVVAEARAETVPADNIGRVTLVEGTVVIDRPQHQGFIEASLNQDVKFLDLLATGQESRTRALFVDDSMLTLGENSRVKINEYVYNPEQNQRSAVINLAQGMVRSLVGKYFSGVGSKFEVHTPTAVAAARGTYFVVWTHGNATGIVNVGATGLVAFTSGGVTIDVKPGEYTSAAAGEAPHPPAFVGAGAPLQVTVAVRGTHMKPENPGNSGAAQAMVPAVLSLLHPDLGMARPGGGVGQGGVAEAGENPPGKDGGVGKGGVANYGFDPPGGGLGRPDGDWTPPPTISAGALPNGQFNGRGREFGLSHRPVTPPAGPPAGVGGGPPAGVGGGPPIP